MEFDSEIKSLYVITASNLVHIYASALGQRSGLYVRMCSTAWYYFGIRSKTNFSHPLV